jgi:hypothetical protein
MTLMRILVMKKIKNKIQFVLFFMIIIFGIMPLSSACDAAFGSDNCADNGEPGLMCSSTYLIGTVPCDESLKRCYDVLDCRDTQTKSICASVSEPYIRERRINAYLYIETMHCEQCYN